MINKLYVDTATAKIPAVQEYIRVRVLQTGCCPLVGRSADASYIAIRIVTASVVAQDLLEIDDFKFLVFAHHKNLLDGIEAQCVKSKVQPRALCQGERALNN